VDGLPPERVNLLGGFFKSVALVQMGRCGEVFEGPQEYPPVPLVQTKSERFFQKGSSETPAPQLRMDEKPAQLRFVRRAVNDGDRPGHLPILLQDPDPIPASGEGKGKLGNPRRYVSFKSVVKPAFPSVEDSMEPDDGPEVARFEVAAQEDT
jgi:hypothetical protein